MKRLLDTAILILCMLMFGSFNTVSFKLLFQTQCPTIPSISNHWADQHYFDKPWFTNMMMFIAEATLLVPFYFGGSGKKEKGLRSDGGMRAPAPQPPPLYYFMLPAGCDVMGTGIASVSMMYIDAAVWQMMRGSIIIFSAILAVVFLKKKLQAYHWIGVSCTVVGLCLIGYASVLQSEKPKRHQADDSGSHVGLGVCLVVLAQVFAAFQCTFEEYLLTGHQVASSQTVGMEGFWGCVLMIPILSVMTVVPGSDHGSYESLSDGLYMFSGSRQLQGITFSYMLSIGIYNLVGMQLCRKLSAVTRCLVDCLRTAVVVVVELGLYYGVSTQYGNPWTSSSWLQIVGFVLLLLGTLIYNAVLKLPGLQTSLDSPQRAVQATWSPTVNRAAAWGKGVNYGPQSPSESPSASPNHSPLAWPFGRTPPLVSSQVPLLTSTGFTIEEDLSYEVSGRRSKAQGVS